MMDMCDRNKEEVHAKQIIILILTNTLMRPTVL